MTARARLDNRRHHEVFNFEHDGIRYCAGVGRYEHGAIAEVFLDAGKAGTAISTYARDGAIMLSLLLQHGCPIEVVRKAITRNPDGSAAGAFGALVDLLAGLDEAPAMASPPIAPKPLADQARQVVREVLEEMLQK